MIITESVLVLLHLSTVVYCFSGSGDFEICDLAECSVTSNAGRRILLENSAYTELFSNCSFTCTTDAYPDCTFCTPPKLVFPDSPVYLLNVSAESLVAEGTTVQLKISDASGNFTVQQTSGVVVSRGSHFLIPLDITGFSCSEVSVQYTLNGSTDKTNLCLDYEPSAPEKIMYAVQGICENGEINNASIRLSWNETGSLSFWVSHYVITLTDKTGNSFALNAEKNTSSVTISNGPLLNSEYTVTIIPFPAGLSTTIQVDTNLPTPEIVYKCVPVYDPYTITYSLRFSWTIINNDCSVTTNIRRFHIRFYSQMNTNGFATNRILQNETNVYPMDHSHGDASTYQLTFLNQSILLKREYQIEINTFYKFIQPSYHYKFDYFCKLSAPPQPPGDVQGVKIGNFTISTNGEASFHVTWNRPRHINGNSIFYQLWVGAQQLELNSKLPQGPTLNNKLLYQTNIDGAEPMLFVQSVQTFSLPVLYAQVISTNDLCMQIETPCFSKWSQPLVFNVPNAKTQIYSSTTNSLPIVQATETVGDITVPATGIPNSPNSEGIPQNILWPLVGVVSGLFLIIVILVTVVVCCCYYGGRLIKRNISMDPMIKFDEDKYSCISYPPLKCPLFEEWEIPRDILEVYESEKLGSGCFGEVCKGSLQAQYVREKKRLGHQHQFHQRVTALGGVNGQDYLPVAVKKLKRTANGKERSDFLKEIDTMIKVSETKSELKRFVVNMLGCCRLEEPILLVVEFVPHGDLLSYLRKMKKKMQGSSDANIPTPYLEPRNEYSHLEPQSQVDQDGNLTTQNLLDFSRQISAGMEFLSGLGIIHRDLACRNILVDTNKQLKISDFGLARTVPQDEVYTLTNHGRLPLRWMALESIFQREFTSTSDVWSFGVLLWEICTMGAFPYSLLTEKELLCQLKRGHRLEQPQNCSYEIYEIMHRCWHPNPNGRPTFSDLHKLFDHFLSKHTQEKYPYIEMDANTPYFFDRLTPQSLSDYQAHMKGVLTIEDVLDGDKTVEYDSLQAHDSFPRNAHSNNSTYTDNKYVESGYNSPIDEGPRQETNNNCCPESTGPTHLGTHIELHRLQRQCSQTEKETPAPPYDRLREEESLFYDREVTEVLNSIYMLQNEEDEFYDEVWQKKLSTITEVSNEDYQD